MFYSDSGYLFPTLLVLSYVVSTVWIGFDAGRRGKRAGSWMLASIFLWPLILPIYFIALRGDSHPDASNH